MKLLSVTIRNFRSCRNVHLDLGSMHAFVGANNAGKSAILKALDFFFNPSTRKINEEAFWNKDTKVKIWIEGVFGELREWEKDILKPYLGDDGSFLMAREVEWAADATSTSAADEEGESEVKISTYACRKMPKMDWLREDKINGENISNWWKQRETLQVEGVRFDELLGASKPAVGVWREKARDFAKNLKPAHFEIVWQPNPTGYANVLKGSLPMLVFVPAVRDIQDESKSTGSSPFGKLLKAIVSGVAPEKRQELEASMATVAKTLNRGDGAGRLEAITRTERQLNDNLKRIFDHCDLELDFQTPDFESLIGSPRLFINDGFRCAIENKGHGLQRATIFAILQSYASLAVNADTSKKRSLIFAVEEPELYMHPQAQRTIRRLFREVAGQGDQVIFSTHSSFMVDVAYFDEIVRVESVAVNEGAVKSVESKVFQLPMERMIADLEARIPALKGKTSPESFRELYSHAYNPNRNEGFFAKKIILVEGDTEEYALPIYAEASGVPLDQESIGVVDCGGKSSMDRLYRIFNELGIPCFVLFDFDKNSTDTDSIRTSQELLKLFGLPTAPPSGALITDRVVCLPDKWEIDIEGGIPDLPNLRAAARKFLGLKADSGKPLVARYIARHVCSLTPPQIPGLLTKIVEGARAAKWSGSCLTAPPSAAPSVGGPSAPPQSSPSQ
jgi:putative ATP-dependent endonuclease of the OLD family